MKIKTEKQSNVRSLTTILALGFFSLSLFVLLVSSSLQIALDIQTQQSAIFNQQLLIAQGAGKTVSNFIQDRSNSLETAIHFSDPIAASVSERKTFMESMLGIHPAFRQLALLDKNNQQLAQLSRISQTISTQFLSHLNKDILDQTKKDQLYLSSVYIDDATSEPLIVLAVPVKDILGGFEGALVTEVDLKFMWNLVDQIKVGNTGYAYVVDAQGNLLAFRDTALVLQGKNVKQLSAVSTFINHLNSPNDVSPAGVTYVGLTGSTVVGAYAPLETPQWAVVVELPWQEAYQNAILIITRSLVAILIIAFIASLIGVLVARRLAKPIIDLSHTAAAVAEGVLNVQPQQLTGVREIIQLTDAFNNMISQLRGLIQNLEKTVQERTAALEKRANQLQTITSISESIAHVKDLQKLLPTITDLISQHFSFYHTGIFFVGNDREFAILQAANSEGGQRMLERGHRLKLGTGVVGFVAQTGLPRIALDVGADAVFFDNPDLPDTRSEVALPLKVRDETIGVLDVQSTDAGAFSNEDLQILTALANQVSIALENARLLTETRAALQQVEDVYNEFTRAEWSRAIAKAEQTGFRYQGGRIEMIESALDSAEVVAAVKSGDSIKSQANGSNEKRTVAVPVKLRGEVIGILQIESNDASHTWVEDEVLLVEAVAERAAFALENSRLFQDARKRAAKERLISEAAARIGDASNIENILQTTAQELERVLGGSEVLIKLQKAQ